MYTRPVLADLSRKYYWITQLMTRGTIITEFWCPVVCFLCPYDAYDDKSGRRIWKSWRHVPALLTMSFHLILWICIRIPSLQILFAVQSVVWLPGSFWDDFGITCELPDWLRRRRHQKRQRTTTWKIRLFVEGFIRNGVLFVLILSILVDFLLAMKFSQVIIRQGISFPGKNAIIRAEMSFRRNPWVLNVFYPISARLMLHQYWKIFDACPRTAHGVLLTGVYDGEVAPHAPRKDLLAVMRTSDWSNATDITYEQYTLRSATIPVNQSAQFGHWRWEAMYTEMPFTQFDKKPDEVARLERIHDFFCAWGNQEMAKRSDPRRLTDVELVFQFADITLHDEGPARFRRRSDIILQFGCPVLHEDGTLEYPDSTFGKFDPFTPADAAVALSEIPEQEQ